MIKVNKDITEVPLSLRVDENSLRKNPAKTTHMRRLEVIDSGSYPVSGKSSNHDGRYKYADIKSRLCEIYHKKCAFCETSAELMHVEHFRPKRGGYYWMAFSWDNLLLSCPTCNSYKGDDFPLEADGVKAEFGNTEAEIENIHNLSSSYDIIEKPLLINPETVTQDFLEEFLFRKDGSIYSKNERCKKTIETCGLDRDGLRQRRKKIWDDIKNEIHTAVALYGIGSQQFKDSVLVPLLAFKKTAASTSDEYIAFRRFLLNSGWIREEIRSLNE